MNIQVRYLSKTGNTKKIAEAIAESVGCQALTIENKMEGETDILFLGAAVYGAGVDAKIKAFINGLDSKIKKVVVFSTAAILPSAYPQMKKLLQVKEITIDEREFHCRGKFLMMHSDRPNAEDITMAQLFAKNIVI